MRSGHDLESRIIASGLFQGAFDSSIEVRLASVSALKHLAGWSRFETDNAFIRLLQDENEFIAGMTLSSAENIWRLSEKITDAIRKTSIRSSSFIRQKALQFFRSRNYKIHSDVNFSEQILFLLKDSDPAIRAEAVKCIDIFEFSDPVSITLPLLKDESENVRVAAVEALQITIGKRESVISALKSINENDAKVFRIAEDILKDMHKSDSFISEGKGFNDELKKAQQSFKSFSEDKEAALYESFLNMHPNIHIKAIHSVLSADPDGKSIPFLIRSLSSRFSEVRHKAAHTLGRMGKRAVTAVPHLISALKDPDYNVRLWTIYALGEIGEKELSIPALLLLLSNSNLNLRNKTAVALAEIKDPVALPYIINEIKKNGDSSEFYYALEKFGSSLESVLPDLLDIYCTKPSSGMAGLLSNLALESENCREEILNTFIRMIKEKQEISSLEGIAGMGRYAEKAVPLLLETVQDENFYKDSLHALVCIGTEQAISAMVSYLDDFNLAQTLGRLNSASSAERMTAVLELSQLAVRNSTIDMGMM